MASLFSAHFDDSLFSDKYQRNNKRGGLKNLRCFPTCATQHKERGYCGRSVVLTVDHPRAPASRRLFAYADFSESAVAPHFSVGDRVNLGTLEHNARTKDQPLYQWIPGEASLVSPSESQFEFNKEKKGWHYGWTSNKHTCNAMHVMQAFVFATDGVSDSAECVAVVRSPEFMLFCRRRRRFTLQPRAPVAQPQPKKSTKRSATASPPSAEPKRLQSSSGSAAAATTRSSSAAASGSSSMKYPGMIPASYSSMPLVKVYLEKDRVDPVLSRLHMAWQRIRATHARAASSAEPKSSEATFLEMLDFLAEEVSPDEDEFVLGEAVAGSENDPMTLIEPEDTHDDDVELDPDLEALARHLINDQNFVQAIKWLRGSSTVPDYGAFVGILKDHVSAYMTAQRWTMEDIDRIIAGPSPQQEQPLVLSEPVTPAFADVPELPSFVDTPTPRQPSGSFSWTSSLRYLVGGGQPSVVEPVPSHVPNLTGEWKQTRASQQRMDEMRTKTGSGWVTSKLFEFMESRFSIEQHGLHMQCRLWPLPSLKFVLDGEEHPWGIRLPLFSPSWTYRGWVDGDTIVLQHEIDNKRLTRTYWMDDSKRVLHSRQRLEIHEGLGFYREVSVVEQEAERV